MLGTCVSVSVVTLLCLVETSMLGTCVCVCVVTFVRIVEFKLKVIALERSFN